MEHQFVFVVPLVEGERTVGDDMALRARDPVGIVTEIFDARREKRLSLEKVVLEVFHGGSTVTISDSSDWRRTVQTRGQTGSAREARQAFPLRHMGLRAREIPRTRAIVKRRLQTTKAFSRHQRENVEVIES